ncbi:SAM-dependent methyltransferase [Actinomadura graeca]|uniref:SAM-dependent methyltransferase n=1 Tax=Actinomadura graeca TaxID=2750812 RepID=A0ABX8R464_9ACTN|nr:SAM-dependent methyltransferase [Actinomadura graeca]QXJ25845.1 SAM-dependent methyltransferase [Actinomadura graeca]
MTGHPREPAPAPAPPPDTATAPGDHDEGWDTGPSLMARLWNLLAAGKDAFPGDREICDRAQQIYPQLTGLARHRLLFRARAVQALVAGHGIDQLLVVGTDLPLQAEVHQIAHRINPHTRVLYTDPDVFLIRTAQALLVAGEGNTACGYLTAGLDDPAALLAGAAATLDLQRPIGVLMLNSLDRIHDDNTAAAAAGALRAALAPGSALASCHLVDDGYDTALRVALGSGRDPHLPLPRTLAAASRFLDGTRLLPPGIVPASLWRPETCQHGPVTTGLWCGIGQIPARAAAPHLTPATAQHTP